MAAYSFLTTWCFDAPIEQVWEMVHDSTRYPEWWKGVTGVVELDPGDENGVGNRSTFSWRSALPYTLAFDLEITRVEPPNLIEAHATGELEGVGIWRLFASPQGTAVLYSWDVDTTRPWMRWLEPIARPAFKWNHDLVMRQGAEGLAARLGVPLIACDQVAPTTHYCIALTTMPDETGAASLARAVVEGRLAACVQILAIRSVYAWEGSVEDASEWLLLMKTRTDRYAEIEEFVAARHPYDVPEILQVPVTSGLAGYLGWVDEQTAAAPG